MNEVPAETPLPFPERICLDFDGVIHQNISPYVEPQRISDPPVPGAFEAIENYLRANFRVAVHSARSYTLEGRTAMLAWFVKYGMKPQVLDYIEFPTHKPGARLYIDDRGWQFCGAFPDIQFIRTFKPWNKP